MGTQDTATESARSARRPGARGRNLDSREAHRTARPETTSPRPNESRRCLVKTAKGTKVRSKVVAGCYPGARFQLGRGRSVARNQRRMDRLGNRACPPFAFRRSSRTYLTARGRMEEPSVWRCPPGDSYPWPGRFTVGQRSQSRAQRRVTARSFDHGSRNPPTRVSHRTRRPTRLSMSMTAAPRKSMPRADGREGGLGRVGDLASRASQRQSLRTPQGARVAEPRDCLVRLTTARRPLLLGDQLESAPVAG